MTTGLKWYLLTVVVAGASAGRWQWPEPAASVRIDTKVRFTDADKSAKPSESRFHQELVLAEDVPFLEPTDTEGFYNRPPGDGRYPVRVRDHRQHELADTHTHAHDRRNGGRQLASDGTLDTLQYCKCVSTPNCDYKMNSNVCGPNQYLCCYQRTPTQFQTSEFFNEISDERPLLHPAQSNGFGPFAPPGSDIDGPFGPDRDHNNVPHFPPGNQPDAFDGPKKQILVGPGGPTGIIGPNKPTLEGHSGGINTNKPILVGPGGPTGIIGPANEKRKKNYLSESEDLGSNESAQRGVLVGPGGPTGIIGPAYNNRPVLVGPGGPTGIIGPRRQFPTYRGGILVGPGGPTGTIGPNRGVLVGPGGPTGRIGPWGYGK